MIFQRKAKCCVAGEKEKMVDQKDARKVLFKKALSYYQIKDTRISAGQ